MEGATLNPGASKCLRVIFVVPFIAAGIARAGSRMQRNNGGIERVRFSIAKWLLDIVASHVCRVALYAAQLFAFFLSIVNHIGGYLRRELSLRLAMRYITSAGVRRVIRETQIPDFLLIMTEPVCDLMPDHPLHFR